MTTPIASAIQVSGQASSDVLNTFCVTLEIAVAAVWAQDAIVPAINFALKTISAAAAPPITGASASILAATQSRPTANRSSTPTTGAKRGATVPSTPRTTPAKDSSTVNAGVRMLIMSLPKSCQPMSMARGSKRVGLLNRVCGFKSSLNPPIPFCAFEPIVLTMASKGDFKLLAFFVVFSVDVWSSPIRSAAAWIAAPTRSTAFVICSIARFMLSAAASC